MRIIGHITRAKQYSAWTKLCGQKIGQFRSHFFVDIAHGHLCVLQNKQKMTRECFHCKLCFVNLTFAPCFNSSSQYARPMPAAPPVTMATLPLISIDRFIIYQIEKGPDVIKATTRDESFYLQYNTIHCEQKKKYLIITRMKNINDGNLGRWFLLLTTPRHH